MPTDEAVENARKHLEKLPGIKEDELARLGPCAVCDKPLLEGGSVTFYRVAISRAGFDKRAIERRVGMGMMMGSDALARVMGPNEDIAKVICGATDRVVHEHCAGKVHHLLQLMGDDQ